MWQRVNSLSAQFVWVDSMFKQALNEAFNIIAESLPDFSYSSILAAVSEDANLTETTSIRFIAKNVFVVNTYLDGKLHSFAGYPAASTFTITRRKNNDVTNLIEKSFYKNGLLHNEDGPAQVFSYNKYHKVQSWYQNGLLHRTDGPAILVENNTPSAGYKSEDYYIQNILHREGGPARSIQVNGKNSKDTYYLFGYEFSNIKAYNAALKRYLKSKVPK